MAAWRNMSILSSSKRLWAHNYSRAHVTLNIVKTYFTPITTCVSDMGASPGDLSEELVT